MIDPAPWPPLADVSVRLTPQVWRLLAPNASHITYEGTNTYLLADEPTGRFTVVDPGSADPAHLDAIVALAQSEGGSIERILLTHTHPDHSEGARELSERVGAPLVGFDPDWADELLEDGQLLPCGETSIEVLHTPGHSDDSAAFLLTCQGAVLTGDTVLANHPAALFGSLRDFLSSVERLRSLIVEERASYFLPAHGPVANNPLAVIELVVAGRTKRLAEIDALITRGFDTVDAIVDELYPAIRDAHARAFPVRTVRSYLDYLTEQHA